MSFWAVSLSVEAAFFSNSFSEDLYLDRMIDLITDINLEHGVLIFVIPLNTDWRLGI